MPQAVRTADSPKIAYVIEPRFSGGTSAAVAAELRVAAGLGQIAVHAVTSKAFGKTQHVSPVLRQVFDELRIPLIWDAPRIDADFVILHNPAFLKFQDTWHTQIFTRDLIVVTHENFLRPGGEEGFDIATCLRLIDASTLALRKSLAPISPYNRKTVVNWVAQSRSARHWRVLGADWFNICHAEISDPCEIPKDRRGRHSRPGYEKFPPVTDMDKCFPKHADNNIVLGADALIEAGLQRPHWTLLRFDAITVGEFFDMIDFFVYFTAPTWQESFGRVIAEALEAGKVVLTDPDTGRTFGDAVISCRPSDADSIISDMVSDPQKYHAQVGQAQLALERYSAQNFRTVMGDVLADGRGGTG
ncbi:glycosyltransferase [Ruegeria sp.]|uniref:glycosyltransferase n=1 Tax=Ruegeria sp. TaxID=1879320 RepID=UPI003C7CD5DE